ncbi:MAG: hypothetical protein MJ065_09810 [Oscillospiraceae bacterium]|nr:hypothetical protein [Oscillospiraceae bacterium]
MDDLTQKLQSLLSDPESMRNLSELAAMLREPDTNALPEQDASSHAQNDAQMPDLTKLLAVGQALSSVQNDDTAQLILALKPHLSAVRAKRADQAVKMLRLYAAAGILRENGMLTDLLGSF